MSIKTDVLKTLPGTSADIAMKVNRTQRQVNQCLTWMAKMGLVKPVGVVASIHGGRLLTVWDQE